MWVCEAAWEAKAQAKYQRGGTMFAPLKKCLHEHRKKKEAQPDRLCLVSLQECGAQLSGLPELPPFALARLAGGHIAVFLPGPTDRAR
uniref:Uncharacterized protein n=1 Tax=Thermosporothrix sp. COM3 TaxID=2490863 RepID=A0A455SFK6_9CHLR|nr:hypothetical protein KTC_20040 [Thermosporothrix sp. COM3]